jgi:hypothetical protein
MIVLSQLINYDDIVASSCPQQNPYFDIKVIENPGDYPLGQSF